jgi:hypothetical protein
VLTVDGPVEPITDSPWFWAAIFTGVALAALLATGGRFGRRQASIENKYQARTAVATGELQIDVDGKGVKSAGGVPTYSTPEKPVIPIWPIEIILGVIFAASLGILLRQRFAGSAAVSRQAAP